jgi:hypothetical protein
MKQLPKPLMRFKVNIFMFFAVLFATTVSILVVNLTSKDNFY